MATATRIKGKGLSFTTGATNDEWKCELLAVVLQNEEADSDVTTFCDLDEGGARQWFIEGEGLSNYGPDSLWTFLWDNAGQDVEFKLAPYGNATPTAAQPHWTGTVTVGPKPAVGGTAGEVFTIEFRMDLVGEPTRVTA